MPFSVVGELTAVSLISADIDAAAPSSPTSAGCSVAYSADPWAFVAALLPLCSAHRLSGCTSSLLLPETSRFHAFPHSNNQCFCDALVSCQEPEVNLHEELS